MRMKTRKINGVVMRQMCIWVPINIFALLDEISAQHSAANVPTDKKRIVLSALQYGLATMKTKGVQK